MNSTEPRLDAMASNLVPTLRRSQHLLVRLRYLLPTVALAAALCVWAFAPVGDPAQHLIEAVQASGASAARVAPAAHAAALPLPADALAPAFESQDLAPAEPWLGRSGRAASSSVRAKREEPPSTGSGRAGGAPRVGPSGVDSALFYNPFGNSPRLSDGSPANAGPAARLAGTRLSLLLLARYRTSRIDILPPLDNEAGLRRFCMGEWEVFASSRPMLGAEVATCSNSGNAFIELPLAHAGIAVLMNHANVWAEPVSVETLLRAIGDTQTLPVRRWNELGAYWPDEPLSVYVPRDVRGLNEFFDELRFERVSKALSGELGTRRAHAEVLAAVREDPNAIALLPIRYYLEQQTRLPPLTQGARLAPPAGIPVRPSEQSIASGYYSPLSRLLVLYVSASVATRPDVADFVTGLLHDGPALSSEPIFLPLQAEQYQQALGNFQAQRLGPMLPRAASRSATVAELLEGIPQPALKPVSPTR